MSISSVWGDLKKEVKGKLEEKVDTQFVKELVTKGVDAYSIQQSAKVAEAQAQQAKIMSVDSNAKVLATSAEVVASGSSDSKMKMMVLIGGGIAAALVVYFVVRK